MHPLRPREKLCTGRPPLLLLLSHSRRPDGPREEAIKGKGIVDVPVDLLGDFLQYEQRLDKLPQHGLLLDALLVVALDHEHLKEHHHPVLVPIQLRH